MDVHLGRALRRAAAFARRTCTLLGFLNIYILQTKAIAFRSPAHASLSQVSLKKLGSIKSEDFRTINHNNYSISPLIKAYPVILAVAIKGDKLSKKYLAPYERDIKILAMICYQMLNDKTPTGGAL